MCGIQVSKIKERVEEKEGIPPVQQRLIVGGKQMYVWQLYHSLYIGVAVYLRMPNTILMKQGRRQDCFFL